MSEVISFRLNKGNPREAQALAILEVWCEEGFSERYVMPEALLKLHGTCVDQTDDKLDELKTTLDQFNILLEQFGNGDLIKMKKQGGYTPNLGLTDSFINSIKKSAKPGMKITRSAVSLETFGKETSLI